MVLLVAERRCMGQGADRQLTTLLRTTRSAASAAVPTCTIKGSESGRPLNRNISRTAASFRALAPRPYTVSESTSTHTHNNKGGGRNPIDDCVCNRSSVPHPSETRRIDRHVGALQRALSLPASIRLASIRWGRKWLLRLRRLSQSGVSPHSLLHACVSS